MEGITLAGDQGDGRVVGQAQQVVKEEVSTPVD